MRIPSALINSTLGASSGLANLTDLVNGERVGAPASPDFAQCNRQYADFPSVPDVVAAVNLVPEGNVPQKYYIDNFKAPKHLPFSVTYRDVVITVDVTGPFDRASIPPQYMTPNEIRDMADYISTACIYTYLSGLASYGGFVTKGIGRLKAQVLDINADIETYPYPVSTAFIVLSITQRITGNPQPGATNPFIPTLMQTWENGEIVPRMDPALREEYLRRAEVFVRAAGPMSVGSSRKWWDEFDGAPTPTLTTNQTINASLNQTGGEMNSPEDSVDIA